MRLLMIVLAMLVGAMLPAVVLAASNTNPPEGMLFTQTTLAQILALHKKAVGPIDAPSRVSTESWIYSKGDLKGTQMVVSAGANFREDTTLGPFHSARGRNDGHEWYQNENGLVVRSSGIHRRDEINEQALQHAFDPSSAVTLLGQLLVPQPTYVVKVAPRDGRVEYVFYDESSYLIVRTERAVLDQRVVTTYNDFRTTNGVTVAWHIHETDGRPFNDEDWLLQSVNDTAPVDRALFAAPQADASHLTLSTPKVALPAQILTDRIILTTQIGRHKVDFQLDSGAAGILLNKSVADALGLHTYGKQTMTTAGTYTSTQTIVPRIELGGAVLENVAVITGPFQEWPNGSAPVAGLMGFDFIANCVVHIDYLHGQVDALSTQSFAPPANAVAVPIRLDDGIPVIDAKIAAAISDRFVLDTGADRSMLFSRFVTGHPSAAADQGLGEQFTEAYPFFSDVTGVGGQIKVTHTQVPSLSIGSVSFPRWLFSVVRDPTAFGQEDYDGLIGQDVLRNFDIYLDYASLKIYFVPNDRYRQRWGG